MLDNLHVRTVALDYDADTHIAEGIIVPWNTPAPIVERVAGRLVRYREQWVPGAFARAERAPSRVPLVYNHSDSFADRLGYAIAFETRDEGQWARFKLDPSRAEQAIDALTTSHESMSIAFVSVVPVAGTELDGALVTRKSALLRHVAAVVSPAYVDARFDAVRSTDDDDEPTENEKAAQADRDALDELIRQADVLVDAGKRWEAFRGGMTS